MVFTAFSSQIITDVAFKVLKTFEFGIEVKDLIRRVSSTIPSRVAVSWLSWILVRIFVTLPYQYMLQLNSFLFSMLRMECCSRMVRGGGPGGPIPYRIYVDSGVVLMSTFGLAPASPLVAPVAFLYFVFCQPLFRRNLIFIYRPNFDGGGLRWPFVFDMCISCMVMGALLLGGQMGLKQAPLPALLAGMTIPYVLIVGRDARDKYLKAFHDAALLQTAKLDGWDATGETMTTREEFRQFLVDAHKAAYVPVCLAATDADDLFTAEPTVVVPLESDLDNRDRTASSGPEDCDVSLTASSKAYLPVFEREKSQRGAMLRRSMYSIPRDLTSPSNSVGLATSPSWGQPNSRFVSSSSDTSAPLQIKQKAIPAKSD